jgi:hypothetical protein
MPLRKVPVEVNFTGGVDTRRDSKLVIQGKLLGLQNARFTQDSVSKRHGSTLLSSNIAGGGTFSSTEAMAMLRDELLRFANDNLYGYNPQSSAYAWVQRGSASDAWPVTLRKRQVLRNSSDIEAFDYEQIGGLGVYAWRVNLGTAVTPSFSIGIFVVNEATGAVVVPETTWESGAAQATIPRVVAVDTVSVLVFYTAGANLKVRAMSRLTPTVFSAAVVLATNANTSHVRPWLDAVGNGNSSAIVVYATSVANGYSLIQVNNSGTVTIGPAAFTATTTLDNLCLQRAASGKVLVFYGPFGVRMRRFDNIFTALAAEETVLADITTNHAIVVGTSDNVTFYPYNEINSTIYKGTVTDAGVTAASTAIYKQTSCRIGSWPTYVDGRYLMAFSYPTATQQVDFVVDAETGAPVARCLFGTAVTPTSGERLQRPFTSGSIAYFPLPEQGPLSFEANSPTPSSPIGISQVTLTVGTAADLPKLQLGKTLHVGGALPLVYDGVSLVEENFNLWPSQPSGSTVGMGPLGTGTYQYCAVYEWIDNNGQRVRSASSDVLSVTFGSGTTNKVTVSGPGLQFTRKASPRASVVVHIFRTEGNGSLFYRVTSIDTPIYNNVSSGYSYAEVVADADLISGELLYTTGGVLDYMPPSAYDVACIHGKRLVYVDAEDRSTIRYSQEVVQDEALAFHPDLYLRIPESAGEATALASMDGRLFVFTSKHIFFVTGDGPNATGAQNSFTEATPLVSDVGCTNWKTLVECPAGLVFLSTKGLVLLDRTLQLQYVGADVEAYNGYTFNAATMLESCREVRFQCAPAGAADTASTAVALVWDYQSGQWSVSTGYSLSGGSAVNFGASDALVYGGMYLRARSDGKLFQESTSAWKDDTGLFDLVAETSWLKLAGLQGFQRVYNLLLLGRCDNLDATSGLQIDVFFDYSETPVETASYAFNSTTQTDGVFQILHRLSRHKCEAVKFRFTFTGYAAEGPALTNLRLECGMKPSRFQVTTPRRA